MKSEHSTIIQLLTKFLKDQPQQTFGQALFNLGINEFQEDKHSKNSNYKIRNIHNDKDVEIIDRIERQLEWYELQKKVNYGISTVDGLQRMTINERLLVTGLYESYNKYKINNKEYAQFILKSIEVDSESIEKILD